jgi:hypothetical protein
MPRTRSSSPSSGEGSCTTRSGGRYPWRCSGPSGSSRSGCGGAGSACAAWSGRWWAGTTFAALLLLAIVALGILTPALYTGTVDVMEEGPALSVAVLVLGLVAPQLSLVARAVRWRWLPTAATLLAALIGVGLLLGGNATSGYDTAHPRPDTLFYGLNADTGEANWATLDPELDEWTKQFLSGETEERTLGGLFGGDDPTKVLTSPAPVAPLKPPELVLLGQEANGATRTLRLHLASPRRA